MNKVLKYINILSIIIIMFLISFMSFQFKPANATSENVFPISANSNSFDFKNNTIYYSNQNEKEIVSLNINNNDEAKFNTTNTPNLVLSDYSGNIFYTETGTFGMLDNQGNHYNTIGTYSISEIYDMCCDINNNIFVICKDATHRNLVLKKSCESENFEIFCELNFNLNTNSKITTSLDKNFLILYSDNFYNITNNECSLVADYILTGIEGNILDITLNYYGTLYVLTTQNFYKTTSQTLSTFTNIELNEAKTFEPNYLTGEIYYLTNSSIKSLDNNFIETLSSNEIDYKSTKYELNFIKTTKQTKLYLYDNSLYLKEIDGETITFLENTTLCYLSKTENDFYYVLINNLKDENVFGYVKATDAEEFIPQEQSTTIRIITQNAPIYLYPTSLDQNLIAKQDSNTIYLNKNTLHKMIIQNFYTQDYLGKQFSKIIYKGQSYYIETNYYVLNGSSTIQPIDTSENAQANEEKLSTGTIVGIILLSITVVISTIFILLAILRKNNKPKK